MTQHSSHTLVVGVFTDATAAARAIEALKQTGFREDQLGFAVRHRAISTSQEGGATHHEQEGKLARGVLGGVIGAIDTMLVPIIGPADANTILATMLPVAEETIDRLPYPGSREHKAPISPDTSAVAESETTPNAETSTDEREVRSSIITGGITGGVIGGLLGAASALLIPGIGPAIAGGIVIAAVGGAAIGGVSGSFLDTFVGLGIPREQAHHYKQELQAGRTIVTVKAEERAQDALDILQRNGADQSEVH